MSKRKLIERVREGQIVGEIDPHIDAREAAKFINLTMNGLQLAARSGVGHTELRAMARFAVDRLKKS